MDLDTIILETDERMQKSTDYLQRELRGLRTGRASTALLEYINDADIRAAFLAVKRWYA